ncbi:MAG: hypothetical protein HFG38_05795 [Eubacterium sp.]|nr:hypothetical protein [Eubacterium sp.]
MSVNITFCNNSYGLLQRNSRLNTIGKSMEGKNLDETKKLTGGVIVPRTKASVSFAVEKERDFLLLPNFEIFQNTYENEKSKYVLDGVEFSGTEMAAVKQVVQSAISIVPRGNLDYRDYASMGIAQNRICSYGKEHLTKEQADVVNRAVSDYFDKVIEHEPKATETIDGLYYGKRDSGEKIQELREYVRNFIATGNLPAYVKQHSLSNMGDGSSLVISASNQELASSIRTRFAMMDWGNEDEVQSVFKQYREWMHPAYMEMNGGASKAAAEATLNFDIAKYKNQYEKITDVIKAVSAVHIDIQI